MSYLRKKPPADAPNINTGKSWSALDLDDLRACLAAGEPAEAIADFLCRNVDEVGAQDRRACARLVVKKPTPERVWEISRIKKTPTAVLGRISAPTAERAVEEWAEKFGITDEHQKSRLVARPVK
jgi:hypothetical protein